MTEPTTTTKERYLASLATKVRSSPTLLALVLRLADGDDPLDPRYGGFTSPCVDAVRLAYSDAQRLGLAEDQYLGLGPLRLTTFGLEVAELVRPPKWRLVEFTDAYNVIGPSGFAFSVSHSNLDPSNRGLAKRVVDLLNADDLAAAKRYAEAP
jgi:hypothetical protein